MKIKVFSYKGFIGVESSPECEGIIAHPKFTNIGVVCKADSVEFSASAVELLKSIPKGHDSLGDINIFKTIDGEIVFSWLGGYCVFIDSKKSQFSRDCDTSLFKPTEGVAIPDNFKAAVDEYLDSIDANRAQI